MATKLIKLSNIKHALRIRPRANDGSGAVDQTYKLSGRISNFRVYKSINFIELVDGSSDEHIQLVVNRSLLKKPNHGSYVTCTGKLVPSRGPKQPIEFQVERLDFLGDCDPDDYPLNRTVDNSGLRRVSHLRPRDRNFASLLRVRSEIELSLHMIMKQMDFFKVHTPCLSSNDIEGGTDLFLVQRTKLERGDEFKENKESPEIAAQNRNIREGYFNKDVYLVTSAQLYLESLAASLSRVYCISPAFRAENSVTKRHLCEFQMFEAEEANVHDLEALMERVESIVKFSAQYLEQISEHKSDFHRLVEINNNKVLFDKLAHIPYIQIDYKEALRILRDKTDFEGDTRFGADIGRVQERKLLDYCDNVPIFIKNYPKRLKPFYMKSSGTGKEDRAEETVECFDLIAPLGGEICGGSLREDSLERLKVNLQTTGQHQQRQLDGNGRPHEDAEANINGEQDPFDWYTDLRRFGTFPHGGFGIGIERLIQSMLGIRNIKDTIAFPRWSGHCPM